MVKYRKYRSPILSITKVIQMASALFSILFLETAMFAQFGADTSMETKRLMIMLTGEDKQKVVTVEDFEKIPQLPIKKTKEFRSVINGIIDKPSSVVSFNWISYSEKSLRQKEIQAKDAKVPDFVDSLPY